MFLNGCSKNQGLCIGITIVTALDETTNIPVMRNFDCGVEFHEEFWSLFRCLMKKAQQCSAHFNHKLDRIAFSTGSNLLGRTAILSFSETQ